MSGTDYATLIAQLSDLTTKIKAIDNLLLKGTVTMLNGLSLRISHAPNT